MDHVLLEICVTTCCGRDVTWLGELFSADGWQATHQKDRQVKISMPSLLGQHAHLRIYTKGDNASVAASLLEEVRALAAHPRSVSVVPLPNAGGREAHTIAHHVVESWQRLAAVTTFVQGDMKANHMMPLILLHDALVSARQARGLGPRGMVNAVHARQIVAHVAKSMNSALPSTGRACLCLEAELPPLLCEAGERSPDFREWPCPAWFHTRREPGRNHLGGYTSLSGFIMRHFLGEVTWPGMEVPWCNAGSMSVTAEQARMDKPLEWWVALRQLLERDRKIKWVSALRLAHVFERLWLRIFSGGPVNGTVKRVGEYPKQQMASPLALPACFREFSATCCISHRDCCCPMRRHPPTKARDLVPYGGPLREAQPRRTSASRSRA